MATFDRVPGIRCSQTARYVVEGYGAKDGRAHGSLDVTVYACAEHLQDARTKWMKDLNPFVVQGPPRVAHRCGRRVDFRDQDQLDIIAAAAADEEISK